MHLSATFVNCLSVSRLFGEIMTVESILFT